MKVPDMSLKSGRCEPCVVQFWSEIILVLSNRTRAARSFNFEITRMISAQIALHSVQLPLYIYRYEVCVLIFPFYSARYVEVERDIY